MSTVLALACSSTTPADPCGGTGNYSGAEACAKLSAPINAKCAPAEAFDCVKFVEPECKATQKFCKTGIDKGVADITATADCTGAKAVKLAYTCFD